MFEDLFTRPAALARHRTAPHAKERTVYLAYCARRGDSRQTLLLKARELLWVARQLRRHPTLDLTIEQLATAARGGPNRDTPWTERRFMNMARPWLRFLGHLRKPDPPIPFRTQLEAYESWAKNERGLSQTTIHRYHDYIMQFLRWFGALARPLFDVQATDIDAYVAEGGRHGWSRIAVRNAATALKAFFRYGATRGWCQSGLAETIHTLRVYASVRLVGKGNKRRTCPLWTVTAEALKRLVVGRAPLAQVFLNRRGQPLTRFGIYRLVRQTVAHASKSIPSLAAKRVSPHTLRHTCAVHLLRAGVDINTIRAWLGHVSLDTTHVYAEVDLEMKEYALARCDVPEAGTVKRWRTKPSLMRFLKALSRSPAKSYVAQESRSARDLRYAREGCAT